mmetsp:Transcript_29550/g.58005  ORF Transcript_29550/g.58005 Transcript_29550/m.58005 type:complete len:390 (+) Transcript_29550:94-1263(+)
MQQQQQKAERGERSRSPRGRTVAVHEVVTPSKPAQPVQEIQTPPKVHHSSTVFAPQAAVPVELQRLKAYVVNLDRRADRWARCEALLQKETPWLEYERFSASDGSKMAIPEEEICTVWNTRKKGNYGDYDEWVYDAPGTERDCVPWRWKGQEPADDDKEWNFVVDNDNCDAALVTNKITKNAFRVKRVFAERYRTPGQDQKMSAGERGCAHSHRRLWEIVAQREQPTMILEDDVQFCFEASEPQLGWNDGGVFTERLILALREAPKDWEVLYLGWSGWRGGNYCILEEKCHAKAVRKAEYVWTTVAYIITPEAARKLLAIARPMDQPVDEFMAWEASQGRLKSFVVTSEGDGDDVWAGGIAAQNDFIGDSDIQKSDGGMQGDSCDSFAV